MPDTYPYKITENGRARDISPNAAGVNRGQNVDCTALSLSLAQSDKMDRSALAQVFVLLFVINTTGWNDVAVGASRVTFTNNGYKNLVVAISPAAHVYHSIPIINNIKVYIVYTKRCIRI